MNDKLIHVTAALAVLGGLAWGEPNAASTDATELGTFCRRATDGTYISLDYPLPLSPGHPCNVDLKATSTARNLAEGQR